MVLPMARKYRLEEFFLKVYAVFVDRITALLEISIYFKGKRSLSGLQILDDWAEYTYGLYR